LRRENNPTGTSQPPEAKKNYGEYLFTKLSSKYDVAWEGTALMIKSINLKLRQPYRTEDILCADTKTVNEFTKQVNLQRGKLLINNSLKT